MNDLIQNITNFWNNKNMTGGDTIIIGLIIAVLSFLSRPLWDLGGRIFKKVCSYINNKIRLHKGEFNMNELIEIEERKRNGKPLTKLENRVLEEHQREMKQAIDKLLKEHPEWKDPHFNQGVYVPQINYDLTRFIRKDK